MYKTPRFVVLAAMVLAAAATRLLPHPPNFAAVGAIALFCGACFSNRWVAIVIPLVAMFLSDLALGLQYGTFEYTFHTLMPVVYGSFALIACIGFLLRGKRRVVPIACGSLAASTLFYLVTNFGVWLFGSLYPKSVEGLLACYTAGIPFFGNTIMGDATFSAVLFGSLALLEHGVPALRDPLDPRYASAVAK
jgi:hypothetical protein